jgi:hypothetical protein
MLIEQTTFDIEDVELQPTEEQVLAAYETQMEEELWAIRDDEDEVGKLAKPSTLAAVKPSTKSATVIQVVSDNKYCSCCGIPATQEVNGIGYCDDADCRKSQEERWNIVTALLQRDYRGIDPQTVKAALAIAACHRITEYQPSWLMSIAPPGSLKTVITDALNELPSIHTIYEVTPHTFISGKVDDVPVTKNGKRKIPASLLKRIGEEGILIMPDFSTVLSMSPDPKSQVLSQLRRIYDGQFRREFGTNENMEEREWKGRITTIINVTPAVDKHYKFFNDLGDRFLRIRWNRFGGNRTAHRALHQTNSCKTELRRAIRRLMYPILSQKSVAAPGIALIENQIEHLSEIVCKGRAYVPRDSYKREIDGEPIIESNTRLPQELAQLARGWALVMGRSECGEDELAIVRQVGWDSMPPSRSKVLQAYLEGRPVTGAALDIPWTTLKYAKEDLTAARLLEEKSGGLMNGDTKHVVMDETKRYYEESLKPVVVLDKEGDK